MGNEDNNKGSADHDLIEDPYVRAQVKCHWKKRGRTRSIKEYEAVARIVTPYLKRKDPAVVCMGTRNNWERDQLGRLLCARSCGSVDIAPASNADWVGSFDDVPAAWDGTMDMVYTNALDHSRDAGKTIERWSRLLAPGGIIIIGFDPNTTKLSESDCSAISEKLLHEIAHELSLTIMFGHICAVEYVYVGMCDT